MSLCILKTYLPILLTSYDNLSASWKRWLTTWASSLLQKMLRFTNNCRKCTPKSPIPIKSCARESAFFARECAFLTIIARQSREQRRLFLTLSFCKASRRHCGATVNSAIASLNNVTPSSQTRKGVVNTHKKRSRNPSIVSRAIKIKQPSCLILVGI